MYGCNLFIRGKTTISNAGTVVLKPLGAPGRIRVPPTGLGYLQAPGRIRKAPGKVRVVDDQVRLG